MLNNPEIRAHKSAIVLLMIFLFISILFLISCVNDNDNDRPAVYYIKVLKNWGAVNSAYTTYLETTFQKINRKRNVKAVIIEVDTPGGSVKDAEKIVKFITQCPFTTITYITNSAYSAGAMISLSSNYTVMAPHAKVGAMEPVMMNPQNRTMQTAPEKIVSAMRAQMRSLAEVRRERLLKEHKNNKRKLKNLTWIKNLPDIAQAMVDKKLVLTEKKHGINLAKGKLLTITTEEALKLGFADYKAKNINTILNNFKISNFTLKEIRPQLKHVFISFLTNQWVAMILIGLGILGLMIEIKTPGWGIPGTFGILALSLFFYSNIVAGNASWEAPVLFIIGIILLGVEIFVIPGFGVVGIAGILCVFASLYTGLGVQFHNFSQTRHLLSKASSIIFGGIGISIVLVIVLAKLLPKTKVFPKIVLMDAELGYKAHDDMTDLIGKDGITVSSLRPSGIAVIEDKRLDVVSQGGFINKNKKIRVIHVEGSRIVVELNE